MGSSRENKPRIFTYIQNRILIFKSVENEQDFEFLAGMLLYCKELMGVVVFTKSRGLSNFTCPWTFAKTITPINFSQ